MNKKKWLTLGVIATALLLIPRRSSRQATPNSNHSSNKDTANQPNQAPLNDKDA